MAAVLDVEMVLLLDVVEEDQILVEVAALEACAPFLDVALYL